MTILVVTALAIAKNAVVILMPEGSVLLPIDMAMRAMTTDTLIVTAQGMPSRSTTPMMAVDDHIARQAIVPVSPAAQHGRNPNTIEDRVDQLPGPAPDHTDPPTHPHPLRDENLLPDQDDVKLILLRETRMKRRRPEDDGRSKIPPGPVFPNKIARAEILCP
jgi:hypothetical protein